MPVRVPFRYILNIQYSTGNLELYRAGKYTVPGENNGGESFVCHCSTYGIILISLILLKNATESIVHVSAI